MSGHKNAGVTMNMMGMAMIQNLGENSCNHGDERRAKNLHNVTMTVVDSPHVFEVHTLTELRHYFYRERR